MRIYQVDAFTDQPFLGNPAGVCLLEDELPETLMQNIALEMNLSETAFLFRKQGRYLLRWFTPEAEENLCGHATLACVHVLSESGLLQPDEKVVFETKSGLLSARKETDYITLDFPSEEASEIPVPDGLTAAIDNPVRYCGRNRLDVLVEVEDECVVRQLKPDINLLKAVPTNRGFIITAKASDYDFVSRFFAPLDGIVEDPVTGSAHCCLAPFWSKKLNKCNLKAYQASKRGGELRLRIAGDRVYISGKAVTTMICDLNI